MRAALLLASAIAVLVVAGCSSSPAANYSSARPSPSGSGLKTASASSSPTIPTTGPNVRPGETPPTPDPLVFEHSAEGAQAFAAYYWQTVSWGYSVANGSAMKGLFLTSCSACAAQFNDFNNAMKNHQSFRGGHVRLKDLGLAANDGRSGAEQAVDTSLDVSQLVVLDASGHQQQSVPAGTVHARMFLTWFDSGWRVVDLGKII